MRKNTLKITEKEQKTREKKGMFMGKIEDYNYSFFEYEEMMRGRTNWRNTTFVSHAVQR